jgi:hypothetical protein
MREPRRIVAPGALDPVQRVLAPEHIEQPELGRESGVAGARRELHLHQRVGAHGAPLREVDRRGGGPFLLRVNQERARIEQIEQARDQQIVPQRVGEILRGVRGSARGNQRQRQRLEVGPRHLDVLPLRRL